MYRLGWRAIIVRVRGKDDVPTSSDVMEFRGPNYATDDGMSQCIGTSLTAQRIDELTISRVILSRWGLEGQLHIGVRPIGQDGRAEDGDIVVRGIGHVVVVAIANLYRY